MHPLRGCEIFLVRRLEKQIVGDLPVAQQAGLARHALGERHQARDRSARLAQDNFLAGRSAIHERGKMRLSLSDVDGTLVIADDQISFSDLNVN